MHVSVTLFYIFLPLNRVVVKDKQRHAGKKMKGKKQHHTTGQGASSPSRPGKPGSPFSPLKPRKPCCEISHLKTSFAAYLQQRSLCTPLLHGRRVSTCVCWVTGCWFPKHAFNLGLTGAGQLKVSLMPNCFCVNKVGDGPSQGFDLELRYQPKPRKIIRAILKKVQVRQDLIS